VCLLYIACASYEEPQSVKGTHSALPAPDATAPSGSQVCAFRVVKCAGTRSAGNPHATCDVAGAGNGALLRVTAPVLDPTSLTYVLSLTRQGSRRMILRTGKVEIGNSGLTEFGTPSEAREEK
jgi:hypothetical protein